MGAVSSALLVIFALARSAPAAVGAYIGAACWFTSSTSFANPAITIGRMSPTPSPGSPRPRSCPSSPRRSSAASRPPGLSRRSTPPSPRPTPPPSSSPIPAGREPAMHLVMIGGSDAGISAALRARELDPAADVTVVLADAYPNFSICGIPYYISGEVSDWRNLAHRTLADLEAAGMRLRTDTTARRIDVPGRKLLVSAADRGEEVLEIGRAH